MRWAARVTGVLAFAASLYAARHLDDGNAGDYATFFGTCAQVVVGLLVVIAVEVTTSTFRGLDLEAIDVEIGLVAGAVSLVSAVAALSPSLPGFVYQPLLAIAVGGASTALVTVILLGVQAIQLAWSGASVEALRKRAELGDAWAQAALAARGESVPKPGR